MQIATRIQHSAVSPVAWVTASPLSDAAWEDYYEVTLTATGAASYAVQSGNLPPGLAIVADKVSGTPSPAPDAPVWVTGSGSLGSAEQGGSFSAYIAATGAASYVVKAGTMPWGLTLDADTGLLSSDLSVIGGVEDIPTDAPVWTTAAGSLGAFREALNSAFFPVSLSLTATDATVYTIIAGRLPWGLSLDRGTGALTGHVWNVGGGTWEPDVVTTWSAPVSPDLGSFARGVSVGTITQTISAGGAFAIIAGVLPWGLSMVRGTGVISGTVGTENTVGTYTFTVSCSSIAGESFGQRTYSITIT